MYPYIEELNDRQKEAVLHKDGPLMIIAGAGSGKTKVLTTRIAHLLNQGVDAFRILALTFTNKAAAEMKERIAHICGNTDARSLFIGTFHSVFAKILRAEAQQLGYPRDFTIYDSDDAKSLIKTIIKEQNLDDKYYKPNIILNRISNAKNSLLTATMYMNDPLIQQEDARAGRGLTGEIYKIYTDRCFRNGAMDFDDLLLRMYQLLIKVPEALSKYQSKFQYILIDEYQDTNMAQYRIIKLLGAMHENICVVGDDAQSIYSFRGATIENILKFKDDYEDVKIIKLEQNYRSTQSILDVANKVIANNKNQIQKNLWTGNDKGEQIKLVRTITDNDEGKFVADAIAEQKLRNHYSNSDFAILYRTNAQSRSFEESLRRHGIPYKIFGGLSFYQRKEIKDLIAYLRIIVNPRDEEAIKRIINYPTRGIGLTTLQQLVTIANDNDVGLWEVLIRYEQLDIKTGAKNAIGSFVTMIKTFQSMLTKEDAYTIAFEVGKHSGLVKDLYSDKTVEGLNRYENVQALLNSIKEFADMPDEDGAVGEGRDLASYLQQIALVTDADDNKDENDVIRLMSIHAAKGLEFPCVFAVGMEENIFPSNQSLFDKEDLEEERRLFYVVITRAKHKLWLTFANSRYRFGSLVQNDPSRFLKEIPEEHLDTSKAGTKNLLQSRAELMPRKSSNIAKAAETNQYIHTPSPNFAPSAIDKILVGSKIEHQRFGFGTVTALEGAGANIMAHISFDNNGSKRIMLSFAKLMVIN